MKGGVALLVAAFLPMVAAARLPRNEPVPGGVAVIELPATATTPRVYFDGQRIMVVKYTGHWYAIVGIPLAAAAGTWELAVRMTGQRPRQIKFSVLPKRYPEQRLIIKNPQLVNPTSAELDRIEREQAHLSKLLDTWVPDRDPALAFIWPAAGPETSGFGLRRFLNGEPRSPHSGIDIGAPRNSPVRAPAAGTVVDVGHYYFCGHTLTISLGQGLYSVYCHLNKIDVKRGQAVAQGQIVGSIGATGRTTGPNLHWTVSLNGTPVDPRAFLIGTSDTSPAVQKR